MNFILEATTNFYSWISLATNTAPYACIDAGASQSAVRFYSATLAR
jgi:hypothetical protein